MTDIVALLGIGVVLGCAFIYCGLDAIARALRALCEEIKK